MRFDDVRPLSNCVLCGVEHDHPTANTCRKCRHGLVVAGDDGWDYAQPECVEGGGRACRHPDGPEGCQGWQPGSSGCACEG